MYNHKYELEHICSYNVGVQMPPEAIGPVAEGLRLNLPNWRRSQWTEAPWKGAAGGGRLGNRANRRSVRAGHAGND